jgi:23S rRNA (adenine2030-N6)-methyltransferase
VKRWLLQTSNIFRATPDTHLRLIKNCVLKRQRNSMSKPEEYQHLKHAGNHCDVLKHVVFRACVQEQLNVHENGIILVDCHAGEGLYDLSKQTSGDFERGVARVVQNLDQTAPPAVHDYVNAIQEADEYMQFYPGSPMLGAKLLREQDEHRLVDLYVEDVEGLKDGALFWQADVFEADAVEFLVPNDDDRHKVILIDPPYLDQEDFYRAKVLTERILDRDPYCTILLWYPMIQKSRWRYGYAKSIKDMAKKKAKLGIYQAWLTVDKEGLQGSGMIVVNPTQRFDEIVDEDTIDWLSATLLNSGRSDYSLEQWMKKKKTKTETEA